MDLPDPSHLLEERHWSQCEKEVLQTRIELQKKIGQLTAKHPASQERAELALLAFTAASTRLLETTRLVWMMTLKKSTLQKRKQELAKGLSSKLKSARKSIIKASCFGLGKKQSREITRSVSDDLNAITNRIVDEFKNTHDPLDQVSKKATSDPSSAGYIPRIKILFFSADPTRTPHGTRPTSALNLDQEYRKIQQSIQAGTLRDSFILDPCLAATAEDFLDALNHHRPTVVHFSGHGSRTDGIVLQDETGEPQPVGAAFLARVFVTLSSSIRLVVLNSCHSKAQAQAIAQAIDVTIGTPSSLADSSAIAFSRGFYGALANGLSVGQAFEQVDVLLTSVKREARPIILHRPSFDLTSFVLARQPDSGIYEPLAHSLESAASDFFEKIAPFQKILYHQAEALRALLDWQLRSESPLALPKGLTEILRKMEDTITAESHKAHAFATRLDEIGRRWSKFFNELGVSKLTSLEQNVADHRDFMNRLAESIKPLFAKIQSSCKQKEVSVRSIQAELSKLEKVCETLGDHLGQVRRTASVHFNQLIEALPGDLFRKGRIKPISHLPDTTG